MSGEFILTDRLARIEAALKSSKVDLYVLNEFVMLRDRSPELDPDQVRVALLAKVRSKEVVLEGTISQIGTIYGIRTPYSAIPGLVENPDVIKLEASKPISLETVD